ncbi:uncharacterized protein LOC141717302 [Apium graveolens]|uniref:uncharacterized protein LOC141717302 n=1 Tax=Apium graveolens TaxID=4045 RepID=UPI003D79631D
MVSRIKTSLLVFLLLFVYLSPGTVNGFSNGTRSIYPVHQDGSLRVNSRKLLSHEVSDYDDAGANTKHDRGRKGGSGKNR